FPLTTISSTATSTTSISVASTSLINAGDYVAIFDSGSYQVRKVTGKSGFIVILDSAVSAGPGTFVLPVELYTLAYGNTGGGTGQNVTISDILPANMLFGGIVSNGSATFLPGSSPAV